jgi:DNA-binding FrmR family transcriptional regulator
VADDIISASKNALDGVWQLPLDEEYDELLKSNFADMANIGGREASSVTAACFLARYTQNYRWAHLDRRFRNLCSRFRRLAGQRILCKYKKLIDQFLNKNHIEVFLFFRFI